MYKEILMHFEIKMSCTHTSVIQSGVVVIILKIHVPITHLAIQTNVFAFSCGTFLFNSIFFFKRKARTGINTIKYKYYDGFTLSLHNIAKLNSYKK